MQLSFSRKDAKALSVNDAVVLSRKDAKAQRNCLIVVIA